MKNPLGGLHTRFTSVEHGEICTGKRTAALTIRLLLFPELHRIEIAAEVPHPAPTDDCQDLANREQQVGAIRL